LQSPSSAEAAPLSAFQGSLLESLRGFLYVLANQRPVPQEVFSAAVAELNEAVIGGAAGGGKTILDALQALRPAMAKRSGGDSHNFITFGAPFASQKRAKH
jgi:hypothetical protein